MARPRKNVVKDQNSLLTPDNVVEIPVEEQPYPLPEGWKWVRLGDLTKIIGGGTPSSKVKEYYDGDIPWLSPADLSDYQEVYISRGKKMITLAGLNNSSARMMPAGTVCLSSRAPIGYVVIAKNPLCTNQGFKSFLPSHLYIPNFLYWYLKGNKPLLESYASGTTFLELSGSKIARIEFPLPTIDEQQRIVDRIESLFAKLDEAREKAEAVLDGFESRKAAILHKAFTGELTAKWRRRERKSDKWENRTLKEICQKITDGTHHSPVNSEMGDYMYITAKNIKEIGVDVSNITYVDKNIHNEIYSRCDVKFGDVLYIKDGATTGIATVNTIQEEFSLLSSVAVLRSKRDLLNPYFLAYNLNSPDIKNKMINNMSGNAITRLTLSKIKESVIAVCPIEEQQEIVRLLDDLLEKERQVKEAAEDVLERIDLMKKAILAKAFRGELTR